MKRIFTLLFCSGVALGVFADDLHVGTPGTLKDLVIDMGKAPTTLTITGKLNSADLAYLNSGEGRMGKVEDLDLSQIELVASEEPYASGQVGTSTVGMGTINAQFFISDSCHIDSSHQSTGLGGAHSFRRYYGKSLSGAFFQNKTLKRVKMPSYITEIGHYTFFESNVEAVSAPAEVTVIETHAFEKATKLKDYPAPQSLQRIARYALKETALTAFDLPASCTELGEYCFSGSPIQSIDLTHIKKLEKNCFAGTALKGNLVLEHFSVIPEGCFSGCKNLESVQFKAGITQIGTRAFLSCSNLKTLEFSEGLKSIDPEAFYYCTKLTGLKFPSSLEYIGENAFNLNWEEQQTEVFDDVYYLGNVAYELTPQAKGKVSLKFRPGTTAISSQLGKNNSLYFPEDLEDPYMTDADRAEYDETYVTTLESVELPSTLKYLGGGPVTDNYEGYGVFAGCYKLKEVRLPEGLEVIGDKAFENCLALNIKKMPKSLRKIGDQAFIYTALEEVVIPDSLKYIGCQAFENCTHLYHVEYNAVEAKSSDRRDGHIFGNVEDVVIGAQVRHIPNYLFEDNDKLARVTFKGEGPLSVGVSAFGRCANLKIVNLPQRLTQVGIEAFEGATLVGREELHLDDLEEAGRSAFEGVKGVKVLHLPVDLKSASTNSFSMPDLKKLYYNCRHLHYVASTYATAYYFTGAPLDTVVVGAAVEDLPSVTSGQTKQVVFEERRADDPNAAQKLVLGKGCLSGSHMSELILPDVQTVIEDRAFASNENLSRIRLGRGTEYIGGSVFHNTPKLKTVDIPSTVKEISEIFLPFFREVKDAIYFHTQEPVGVRFDTNYRPAKHVEGILYVPAGSEKIYDDIFKRVSNVEIHPYALKNVAMNHATLSLPEGAADSLALSTDPVEYYGLQADWSSSHPDVVKVDAFGRLMAVKEGKAVVTATLSYMPDFKATCEVTVGEATGIGDVVAEEVDFSIEGNCVVFHGGKADAVIRVYTMDGKLVASPAATETLSLPRGLYVINVNGKMTKVMI